MRRPALRRLRPIHRRMSRAAFDGLPRRLGWRYEFCDGIAWIGPEQLFVHLVLELSQRSVARAGIRPARPDDVRVLERGFLRAFARTPDYARFSTLGFRQAASDYLLHFFGNVRGDWLSASMIAEVKGQLAGAALIKRKSRGPLLDCLFVVPEQARQGWATALGAHAVNQLLAAGETQVFSQVHLANEPSLCWHLGFGFRELPSLLVAEHRWRHHADQLERQRQHRTCSPAELADLEAEEEHWRAECDRLAKLECEDFWAVHPCLD